MTSKLTIEQTQQIIDAADAVITALAGTNDEVHKDDTDKMVRLWDDLNDRYAPPEVVRELARMALAAMDSEPVAYTDERNLGYIDRGAETGFMWGNRNLEPGDIALYRHAQSAPERDQVRREHAEWSQATFGDVGPVGPLKHLSKEALEAAAEPGDLSEWADMQFLLWDAQRRAGITDEQITQALIEKLAVNKQREWPEPKDGEPRLHIKEQPAPVVPDENVSFHHLPGESEYDRLNRQREWMESKSKLAKVTAAAQDDLTERLLRLRAQATLDGSYLDTEEWDSLACDVIKALNACRAAMLNGGNDE